MPNSNVIELVVKVSDQATAQLRGISARIGPILGKALIAGSLLAGVALRAVVKATKESQAAAAQLDAAYRATGGTLGRTREELDQLSASIQRTTVYEDDLVASAQAILLTFDRVRGDAFERTIRASTDLAARLGTDLPSAVRTLGIALQDPEQGMMRLRRAGIIFTDEQKKIIKGFVDTGQAAKAQAFILGEVERRFADAAAAARGTLGGALQALNNAYTNLLEQSSEGTKGLVEAINSITETLEAPGTKRAVTDFFTLFIQMGEKTIQTLVGIGVALGLVGGESEQISQMIERLQALRDTLASKTAFGLGTKEQLAAIALLDQRIAELAKRQQAVLDRGGQGLLDPSRKPKSIAAGGELAPVLGEDQIKALNAYLPKLDQLKLKLDEARANFLKIQETFPKGSEEWALAARALEGVQREWNAALAGTIQEVQVLGKTIERVGFDKLFDDLNEKTKTALEKNIDQWHEFNAEIEFLLSRGLPKAVADARLEEKLDELIPEVKVTVQRIDTRPFQELTAAGKFAAEEIQRAFATAFRGIFEGDSFRDIGRNFLRAFAEIPVQIAAEQFSARVRKAMEPTIAKVLGTAGGVAGAAGPTAQERAAGIVEAIKRANASTPTVVAEVKSATGITEPIVQAVQSSQQSMCECVCSCLQALRESLAGGPDAVVAAIGGQVDASKTIARTASQDVVAGVDATVRTSTSAIVNKLTEVANFLAPSRATTGSKILGAVAGVFGAMGQKSGTVEATDSAAGGGMASGRVRVGEEGPELVDLPRGSRVTNQRQAAFAGTQNLTMANQYHVTISGGDDPRRQREELLRFFQMQDDKQKRWTIDVLRTNFGRVVTP